MLVMITTLDSQRSKKKMCSMEIVGRTYVFLAVSLDDTDTLIGITNCKPRSMDETLNKQYKADNKWKVIYILYGFSTVELAKATYIFWNRRSRVLGVRYSMGDCLYSYLKKRDVGIKYLSTNEPKDMYLKKNKKQTN